MKDKPVSFAKRLLVTIGIIIVGLVVVHLFLQHLNMNVFHQQNGQVYELSNRFDLDDESSVPTWLSQALFLAISVAAVLAAYLENSKSKRWIWSAIAIITLVFSIDEIATLHEFTLETIHVFLWGDANPTGLANAWLYILPFVAVSALALLWKVATHLPRRTTMLLVMASVAFLIGAIGVDIVTSTMERDSFLSQGIMVAIEESLELGASLVVLYTIADYIETHYRKRLSAALAQLRQG